VTEEVKLSLSVELLGGGGVECGVVAALGMAVTREQARKVLSDLVLSTYICVYHMFRKLHFFFYPRTPIRLTFIDQAVLPAGCLHCHGEPIRD